MQDVYRQTEQETNALTTRSQHTDSLTILAEHGKEVMGNHCRELATPHPSRGTSVRSNSSDSYWIKLEFQHKNKNQTSSTTKTQLLLKQEYLHLYGQK